MRGLPLPPSVRRAMKLGRVSIAHKLGSARFDRPALFGIDTLLAKYLDWDDGTFLEIGANDGYSQSNTYFLERTRGWTGILIEPQKTLSWICERMRPQSDVFNVACVAPDAGPFVRMSTNYNDLAAVALGQQPAESERQRIVGGRTLRASATTLSHVIDESHSSAIDFMSIDVEGAEFEVLRGLELDRHCPKFLLVETDRPAEVGGLLGDRMTEVEQLTFHDYLWARA